MTDPKKIDPRYRLTDDPIETARRIASEYGLSMDEGDLGYVIWNCTGFPAFWDIPRSGANAQECFEKQLRAALADKEAG